MSVSPKKSCVKGRTRHIPKSGQVFILAHIICKIRTSYFLHCSSFKAFIYIYFCITLIFLNTKVNIESQRSKIFFNFIYLFLERGEGREKKRERNTNVWLPLAHPLLETCSTTQACASAGNGSGDPLVCRLALNPLSHTSQSQFLIFYEPKKKERIVLYTTLQGKM